MPRPRIAILGRFAEHTSVTRFSALVTAERLLELVWQAGGEPLTLYPVAGSDWAERLDGIDGVLMPGGGDIDPRAYGETHVHEQIYGVNPLQDEVDFSLVRYAFEHSIPVLTVCRGTQIANIALGGTLHQHVDEPHLHHVAEVSIDHDAERLGLSATTIAASCYHHQALNQLGRGVTPIAHALEGHIEAVTYDQPAWSVGLQWHPEDNFDTEPAQLEIVRRFVTESAAYRASRSAR